MTIINSERKLAEIKGTLDRDFKKHKYLSVKILKQKRSIVSNALQFQWYRELENQGDQTLDEYRNYCKYHFGLAIRAASDSEFADVMRGILLSAEYDQRLKMMKYVDVTSTFTPDQMGQYLTAIEQHFVEQGFILT